MSVRAPCVACEALGEEFLGLSAHPDAEPCSCGWGCCGLDRSSVAHVIADIEAKLASCHVCHVPDDVVCESADCLTCARRAQADRDAVVVARAAQRAYRDGRQLTRAEWREAILALCLSAAPRHRRVLVPWVVEVTHRRVIAQRRRFPYATPAAIEIWDRLASWRGDREEIAAISADAQRAAEPDAQRAPSDILFAEAAAEAALAVGDVDDTISDAHAATLAALAADMAIYDAGDDVDRDAEGLRQALFEALEYLLARNHPTD